MNDNLEFIQPTDEEVCLVRGWIKLQQFWRNRGEERRVPQHVSDSAVHGARFFPEPEKPVSEHRLEILK